MTSVSTLDDRPTVTSESFDVLFREARTANTFTKDPVPEELLRDLYELVKFGPTAANSQPLRIVFVTSDEANERLAPLMSDGNREKTHSAPVVAILAADTDFHETLPEVFPHNPGAKDWFPDPVKRRRAAELNASLQIGYFILAARGLGLAVGPMNGFDAEGVDKEFFAGTNAKSLVIANLGRPGPDAWQERLPRHDIDRVVSFV